MIIEVAVVPKSCAFSILVKDGKLKVRLTSPPEKGEANAELVKGLSRALGGRAVRILSGQASRKKRLEVGVSAEEWAEFLAKCE